MTLTPEQIKDLKSQLSNQIKHLPQEQREAAQKQIESMSDEAIESMLEHQKSKAPSKEIYRAIVSGEITSKKIDENKSAIAVLEIKPISKGHTIIIPKTSVGDSKKIPTQAFTLAKKVSKKIVSKLKATGTEIQSQFLFGEIILNVIPIYEESLNLTSPRYEAKPEELEEVFSKLKTTPRKKVVRQTKKTSSKIIKLKRRIP